MLTIGCTVQFILLVEGASFCGIFDVHVDQEQVCFAVDVFDGNLEAVEASGFRQHDFGGKVAAEIYVDNAVRCRKNNKDVGYELLLC